MPDISLLLRYIDKVKSHYFAKRKTYQERLALLQKAWQSLVKDRLPLADHQINYPGYKKTQYRVLSVDSSPIDLSRHRSIPLKALSLSRVLTDYKKGEEIIESEIQDIPESDEIGALDFPLRELQYACDFGREFDVIMLDGSLIRWQWWQLQEEKRAVFVKSYADMLNASYAKKQPVLGIIDRSLSRDITHLLELATKQDFAGFVDMDLFQGILQEDQFSPVFVSYSPITKLLPEYKVAYCYYKKWNNVLRLEFLQKAMPENVWQYCVDQVEKGKGFPWSIARAHDLCVVKESQKQAIERLLTQEGLSQKEIMKRTGS